MEIDLMKRLDQEGIGQLIEIAILKARRVNPRIKIGIYGDQTRNPETMDFAYRTSMDYISYKSAEQIPIQKEVEKPVVVSQVVNTGVAKAVELLPAVNTVKEIIGEIIQPEKKVVWVREDLEQKGVYLLTEEGKKKARVSEEDYKEAAKDPVGFFTRIAGELKWFKRWDKPYQGKGYDAKWFRGGKINASYNCIDRHIKEGRGDEIVIYFEPENLTDIDSELYRKYKKDNKIAITYNELLEEVSKFANVLKSQGVKKGDVVGIYMPGVPEALIAMLACSRIGAVHNVVFSNYAPDALRVRLQDSNAKVLITSDGYYYKGRQINLKEKADEGLKDTVIKKVIVLGRTGQKIEMKGGRDFYWNKLMEKADKHCEPEWMDSEDPLFYLYTSGTTGKPKGIIHGTGGYLTLAKWTGKAVFGLDYDSVILTTADQGWITGHTYKLYAPLLNGAGIVLTEGNPFYPNNDRTWETVEKYGVNILYTAPTAIRVFKSMGEELLEKHDLSTLEYLGSVGEPIDPDTYLWYLKNIGRERCPVSDTWWQTELGVITLTSILGPFIPGKAGKALPGIEVDVIDEKGNPVESGVEGFLIIRGIGEDNIMPPSILRGVLGWDNEKYIDKYWRTTEDGKIYYYAGDRAIKDKQGNIQVLGRSDDVILRSGENIDPGRIEDVLNSHKDVVEVAVGKKEDKKEFQVPVAFIILKEGVEPSEKLKEELLKAQWGISSEELKKDPRKNLWGIPQEKPGEIYFVKTLPKTESGKVKRGLLTNMLYRNNWGDITTLGEEGKLDLIKIATQLGYTPQEIADQTDYSLQDIEKHLGYKMPEMAGWTAVPG